MPGYFVLADSISSPFLLPFPVRGFSAKRLEAGNELGIPGVMAEAGGPPGGSIAGGTPGGGIIAAVQGAKHC